MSTPAQPSPSEPSSNETREPVGPEELTAHAEALLDAALEYAGERRAVPTSTYRLQFHAGFRFRDAKAILPYLEKLGVTDCYASPYLKAAPGSTHGYDITDHTQLNPEIGDDQEHAELLADLRQRGMGLVLDVVPNHMGILGNENPWWNDVMENGQASIFAPYFDIDWFAPTRPENRGRIILPLLGDLYGRILEQGELRLGRNEGAFHVDYHDHRFPIDPQTYLTILEGAVGAVVGTLGEEDPAALEYQSILTATRNLPAHSETDHERVAERNREKEIIKRRLADLLRDHPDVARAVDAAVESLNGTPGDPRSFDALDALLESQPYRLAFWRVASDEINYRRFFDINALAALRADREEVFRATHRLIFDILVRQGATGLRIDHPDGLLDPLEYLQRLQEALILATAALRHRESEAAERITWEEVEPVLRERLAARDAASSAQLARNPRLYVVIEKILAFDELIPEDWPTHGTSGYEAMNRINGLFVDSSSAGRFSRGYEELIENPTPYRDIIFESKELIMDASLSSELHVLSHQLERIALRDRLSRDFTLNALRGALREVIAAFPVYRSYITENHVGPHDRELVNRAIRQASRRNPLIGRAIFDFQRRVLLERPETPEDLPENEPTWADFAGKFQQVTSPVTAKGIEDTAFYVYNRLISLNEVGGEPNRFGTSRDALHKWSAGRASRFPFAMTALSTHDTKRSEDVRARINVLSEIPDEWFDAFARWSDLNARHRTQIDETDAPDRNEEYLLYQTLLGAWPIEEMDEAGWSDFRDRIRGYMSKAIHEAKVHTSWQNPYEEYDQAVDQFVVNILDPKQNAAFLDDFLPLQRKVSLHGRINGLSQTLLKLTMPGVPDTYQGSELWDFSLVDPDNRRPVDYDHRRAMLDELSRRFDEAGDDRRALARELADAPIDGRSKLYVVWRALQARKRWPDLFAAGEYVAAPSFGQHEASLFAFRRAQGAESAVVAVPRLSVRLACDGEFPLGEAAWGDSGIRLPGVAPGTKYQNAFTGATITTTERDGEAVLMAADLFADFPVALLIGR